MTSKTTRLLQSDYLNKNNYKSIEGSKDSNPTNDVSMAPIISVDKKDLFSIDGKISHVDNEMMNNRSNMDNEESGQCFKIFCGGLNVIIFTGIGLCLLILLVILIMSN